MTYFKEPAEGTVFVEFYPEDDVAVAWEFPFEGDSWLECDLRYDLERWR